MGAVDCQTVQKVVPGKANAAIAVAGWGFFSFRQAIDSAEPIALSQRPKNGATLLAMSPLSHEAAIQALVPCTKTLPGITNQGLRRKAGKSRGLSPA